MKGALPQASRQPMCISSSSELCAWVEKHPLLGNAFLLLFFSWRWSIWIAAATVPKPGGWLLLKSWKEFPFFLFSAFLRCSILAILPFLLRELQPSSVVTGVKSKLGAGGKLKFLLKMALLFLLKMLPWTSPFLAPELDWRWGGE